MIAVEERFGTRLMLACDVRDIPSKGRAMAIKELLMPIPVSERAVTEWLTDGKTPSLQVISTLAARLDVNDSWLGFGKDSMRRDRKSNTDTFDLAAGQKNLFNFDSAEQRNTGLAWVLMHQPEEVVADFCNKDVGHDVYAMRVEIRVNDVELPIKRFEDLIAALAIAMMNWRFAENGLHSLEASAKAQAEQMFKKAHDGMYDSAYGIINQLDVLRDQMGGMTDMYWAHSHHSALHNSGLFAVTLPARPEQYDAPTTRRDNALKLFCRLIKQEMDNTPGTDEFNKLEALYRSVYGDLDARETLIADSILLNKELA